jgi:predicted house-cleaning noncanonical NTP pyrophosphatase (MazG superfamily)
LKPSDIASTCEAKFDLTTKLENEFKDQINDEKSMNLADIS